MGIRANAGDIKTIKGVELECVKFEGRKVWMVGHSNSDRVIDLLSGRYSLNMPKYDSLEDARLAIIDRIEIHA